jgi:hypothetical protein
MRASAGRTILAILLGCASAIGQAYPGTAARTWLPHSVAMAMLCVALPGRRGGRRAERSRQRPAFAWLCIPLFGTFGLVAELEGGQTNLISTLPVLLPAALAEEIIYRDDLLSSFMNCRALSKLSANWRASLAILSSQAAFAVAHVPVLMAEGHEVAGELAIGIAVTFCFGCLMAGISLAGGGVGLRTSFHVVVNVIAISAPWPLGLHVARLLGSTAALWLAVFAVRLIGLQRTTIPTASRPDLPSAPSPGPGTAPPADRR